MVASLAGFRIPKDGMREFQRYVRTLMQGDLKKIHGAAGYAVARAARKMIQEAYHRSAYPHTDATKLTYAKGKRTGLTPARRTWSGKSLVRSGQLASSIVVRKRAKGYSVEIDPKKTYTRGDPVDSGKRIQQIAAQMEDPQPILVTVTHAMLAYLHSLGSRRIQPGSQSGLRVGSVASIYQTPKKVWEPTYRKLGKLKPVYYKTFHKYLKQKTGRRRFPGLVLQR